MQREETVVIQLKISEQDFINNVKLAVQEQLAPVMKILTAQRITVNRASELLNVTPKTLKSYVKEGLLNEYKDTPSSHPRFNLAEVIELANKKPKYKRHV